MEEKVKNLIGVVEESINNKDYFKDEEERKLALANDIKNAQILKLLAEVNCAVKHGEIEDGKLTFEKAKFEKEIALESRKLTEQNALKGQELALKKYELDIQEKKLNFEESKFKAENELAIRQEKGKNVDRILKGAEISAGLFGVGAMLVATFACLRLEYNDLGKSPAPCKDFINNMIKLPKK